MRELGGRESRVAGTEMDSGDGSAPELNLEAGRGSARDAAATAARRGPEPPRSRSNGRGA